MEMGRQMQTTEKAHKKRVAHGEIGMHKVSYNPHNHTHVAFLRRGS